MDLKPMDDQRQAPLTQELLYLISNQPGLNFLDTHGQYHGFSPKQPELLLSSVLETAQNCDIQALHQTQACSALFSLVEHFQRSSCPELQALASTMTLWNPILGLFLEKSKNLKARTLKRLLAILLSLFQSVEDEDEKSSSIRDLSLRITTLFSGNESASSLKRALQALEFFMRKSVLHPVEFANFSSNRSRRVRVKGSHVLDDEDDSFNSFSLDLLQLVTIPEIAPAVGGAIKTLFSSAFKTETGSGSPQNRYSWGPILLKSIYMNLENLEVYKHHIFPGLFELDQKCLLDFLHQVHFRKIQNRITQHDLSEQEMVILCSALEVAKSLGKLKEFSYIHIEQPLGVKSSNTSTISLDDNIIRRLTTHHSPEVRSSALALLISSPSSSIPFTSLALDTYLYALPYYCGENESKMRNIFLGWTLKLLDRIRAVTHNLRKRLDTRQRGDSDDSYESRTIAYHHVFILDFFKIIQKNLHPLSQYPTALASLKAIEMLLSSGLDSSSQISQERNKVSGNSTVWPFRISIFTKETCRCLPDLLFSPFDDLRILASKLLKSYNHHSLLVKESSPLQHNLSVLLERSETKAEVSGRSDHADGQARVYEINTIYNTAAQSDRNGPRPTAVLENICDRLEAKLVVAEQDLPKAVASMPIHGELIGLRYVRELMCQSSDNILDKEKQKFDSATLVNRLYQVCCMVWDLVEPILCDDSPEGFDKLDSVDSQQDVGTKELLSFCWRSLKESSLLLRQMIEADPGEVSASKPSSQVLLNQQIGQLSFRQLSSLRHRGAITTVAGTFSACCKALYKSHDPAAQELLDGFYIDTIGLIHGKSTILTRRSAGIPFLMIGILSANVDSPVFQQAFSDLMNEAQLQQFHSIESHDNLPQVHALNCLKDLFMSSSIPSETSITSALHIAAASISSHIWAIRNCGLMLFSALIDRICGVKVSQDVRSGLGTYKIGELDSYSDYPGLSNIIFELLQSPESKLLRQSNLMNTAQVERVLLALEIICRAGLPQEHRSELLVLVKSHFRSPVWHIRVLAARAYALSTYKSEWSAEIVSILDLQEISSNERHSRLLCALNLYDYNLHESFGSHEGVKMVIDTSAYLRSQLSFCRSCPFILGAFLDVNNLISKALLLHVEGDYTESFKRDQIEYLKGLVRSLDHGRSRSDHSLYGISYGDTLALLSWLEKDIEHLKRALSSEEIEKIDTAEALITDVTKIATNLAETLQIRHYMSHVVELIVMMLRLASRSRDMQKSAMECVSSLLQLDHQMTERLASRITESAIEIDLLADMQGDVTTVAAPSSSSAVLRWRGSVIAVRHLSKSPKLSNSSDDIYTWVHLLHKAGAEKNSFDIRLAAIQSLCAANAFLALPEAGTEARLERLGAYLVLYDCLNDDDEDIRVLAAEAISKIVASHTTNQIGFVETPLAAATTFISWLTSFMVSQELCEHTIARLTGATPDFFTKTSSRSSRENTPNPLAAIRDPVEILADAMDEDHALFAEEKQNLCISSVREAERWSQVAIKMGKAHLPPTLVDGLILWVESSLRLLVRTAEAKLDGPLGWTSNPDVFDFGTRVIYAAEVLFGWSATNSSLFETLQSTNALLRKLVDNVEQGRAHELWASRILTILH